MIALLERTELGGSRNGDRHDPTASDEDHPMTASFPARHAVTVLARLRRGSV
jgi:hypothetical protein